MELNGVLGSMRHDSVGVGTGERVENENKGYNEWIVRRWYQGRLDESQFCPSAQLLRTASPTANSLVLVTSTERRDVDTSR